MFYLLLSAELSNLFVVCLGIGVVFVGLVCLILICKIMGYLCTSFIHVKIEGTENQIICDIQNSNHPKSASDHSGHGIGLVQVQRRLDLSYPNSYDWQYGPTDDGIYHSRIVINLDDNNKK